MKHASLYLLSLLVCTDLPLAQDAPGPAATNFFPVMAWNWAPSDPAVLRRMREAGLTVAGFVAPDGLDACQAAGLKAIVSDPRSSNYDWANVNPDQAGTNIQSLVEQVGRHPAVYGYYLRDEPNAALFPGLATVASLIRELSPGKWPYINLFPDYASPAQLGTSNYLEHLERFVTICQPRIISYDNYSLMDDGSVRESYWSNLEAVRATSRKHGLEFWNIVLATAHFHYRELTAADFRFQVYTTLAYGGRGISYFTYFAPQVGNYRMGPIDQFGNETPNWYFLQNVNLQVGKLAPTLLQLTSNEVYHFGKVPSGAKPAPADSLVASVSGDNSVVGEFTHADGSRYVMIVNKDLAKSNPCSIKFRQSPRGLQLVSPYTGQLTGFAGEQVWLAPGQGALLKLEL
jgi:hypothetical protein